MPESDDSGQSALRAEDVDDALATRLSPSRPPTDDSMLRTALASFVGATILTLGTVHAGGSTPLTSVRVASGLASPVFVTAAPDDYGRLFIVERAGRIKILDLTTGSVLGTNFLDITGIVANPSGFDEEGLFTMAFHPDYANNGFFYVNYTDNGGDTVVSRYSVSAGDPNVAEPASAQIVIGPIFQPQANHNGGCIAFGGDGKLYVGMGDGGNFNDIGSGHAAGGNAQSNGTLLGKMLRLDVDIPFPHFPADNPYVGNPAISDAIWAFGVRNPWRFSFDRLNGNMYMGDVGQDTREEINFQSATSTGGENYGWPCMEGEICGPTGGGCTCMDASLELPIQTYANSGARCSVTGGYVYRGCGIPDFDGTYFYGDLCSNQIWSFDFSGGVVSNFTNRTAELAPNVGVINNLVSFGEDAFGEMYIVDLGGEVFKIVPASQNDCNANMIDDGCETSVGLTPDVNMNGVPDDCDCPPASTYCIGKINSQFCLPAIGFTGSASIFGSPFDITADMVLNNKNGLLFYGLGPDNSPFFGGTLCVMPPLRRTGVQASGGNPPPNDCSGTFSFDMDAQIASDPVLAGGVTAYAQYWYRDPGDGTGIGLTDAVQFTICDL